jgi:hypothetical protein
MTIACRYPDTNDVARPSWRLMVLRSTRNWIIRVLRQLHLVGVAYEIRFWISILANHANNKQIARTLSAESFPPYRFAFEAYSHVDYSKYYEGGRRSAEVILELIAGHVELIGAKLLEWGCGPGRIVRHLAPRCRLSRRTSVRDLRKQAAKSLRSTPCPGFITIVKSLHKSNQRSCAHF